VGISWQATRQPLWRGCLRPARNGKPSAYASLLHYGDDGLLWPEIRQRPRRKAIGISSCIANHPRAVRAAQDASGAGGTRIMLDVNCAWSPPVAPRDAASLPWRWTAVAGSQSGPRGVPGLASVSDCGIRSQPGGNVAACWLPNHYTRPVCPRHRRSRGASPKSGGVGGNGKVMIHLCQAARHRGGRRHSP